MTTIVIAISSLNLPSTNKVYSFIEFNKNNSLGYLQVSSSKFQYNDEVYNPLITKEHGFFSTHDIETIKNIQNVLSIYPELRLQSIISIPAPENTFIDGAFIETFHIILDTIVVNKYEIDKLSSYGHLLEGEKLSERDNNKIIICGDVEYENIKVNENVTLIIGNGIFNVKVVGKMILPHNTEAIIILNNTIQNFLGDVYQDFKNKHNFLWVKINDIREAQSIINNIQNEFPNASVIYDPYSINDAIKLITINKYYNPVKNIIIMVSIIMIIIIKYILCIKDRKEYFTKIDYNDKELYINIGENLLIFIFGFFFSVALSNLIKTRLLILSIKIPFQLERIYLEIESNIYNPYINVFLIIILILPDLFYLLYFKTSSN